MEIVIAAKRNGEKCLRSRRLPMLDLFEVLLSKHQRQHEAAPVERPRSETSSSSAARVVEVMSSQRTLSVHQRPSVIDQRPVQRTSSPTACSHPGAATEAIGPIRFLRIDGSNSGTDRQRKLETFQGVDSDVVCSTTTRAGGVGITLTAATRVILLDCSFNPADDRQAMGRAYRYGQTKPVYVYRLVCRDSMEHRILDQKVSKEWMFHTVVDEKQLKRDALQGVKLRRLFVNPEDMKRPIGARALEVTQQLIQADPIGLGAIRRSMLTAASRLVLGSRPRSR